MENETKTENTQAPPPGVSGKKVAIVVLALLIGLVGSISYVLSSYNSIDDARKEAGTAWIELADELSARYKQVELDVAKRVDDRSIDMELGEEFRLALDRFRGTSILEKQLLASQALEQLLSKMGCEEEPTASAMEYATAFNECIDDVQRRFGSLGGQILGLFLNFPELTTFRFAAE
ncbi:MAG: hypothetical protein AAF483_18820 [Planctomycetota bacterium]